MGQRLIVWAVHGVLAFVFLFVGAWTTAAAHRWPAWLDLVLLGVLVAAGFLIDQTWLSLHPFYRTRLASAFAVRRARMPDGGVGALAYAIEEPTTLSTYGRPVDGFPQVIFVAAAALSGQSRTPPGRRAASFSLSWDYVGGPDVGWVRTSTLEETCKPALRRDVTVQAAMAVSGAAIASAMGRHAAAVQRQYPEPFRAPGEAAASSTGTLIVAKALLTRDVPYELLSYARKETAFPHQSTGDQFFDHEQFDAYRALGFHIGTAAAAEVTGRGRPPSARPSAPAPPAGSPGPS